MFQVNYLSHLLIILHLIPLLRQSAPNSRIVFVSSYAHRSGLFDLDNIQGKRSYNLFTFYNNSKLYLVRCISCTLSKNKQTCFSYTPIRWVFSVFDPPPPHWRSHYNQLNWDTIVMVQWALISIASLLYLPYVANVRRIFYFLQVMIMYVLDRRLKSSGIGVFALHPGLVESNILPNSPNVFVHIAHRFMKLFRKFPVAPLCVPWKKSTKTLTDDYLQNHNNNDNNKQNKTEDMKQYFLWRKY